MNDNFGFALLLFSALAFGGSAAIALIWAIRSGQFGDMKRGARSIFDADEPMGQATDGFPHPDAEQAQDRFEPDSRGMP